MKSGKFLAGCRGLVMAGTLLLTMVALAMSATRAMAITIDPNPVAQDAIFEGTTATQTSKLITPNPDEPNYKVCELQPRKVFEIHDRGSLHVPWEYGTSILTLHGGLVPKIEIQLNVHIQPNTQMGSSGGITYYYKTYVKPWYQRFFRDDPNLIIWVPLRFTTWGGVRTMSYSAQDTVTGTIYGYPQLLYWAMEAYVYCPQSGVDTLLFKYRDSDMEQPISIMTINFKPYEDIQVKMLASFGTEEGPYSFCHDYEIIYNGTLTMDPVVEVDPNAKVTIGGEEVPATEVFGVVHSPLRGEISPLLELLLLD
jgi:hypothetical protein